MAKRASSIEIPGAISLDPPVDDLSEGAGLSFVLAGGILGGMVCSIPGITGAGEEVGGSFGVSGLVMPGGGSSTGVVPRKNCEGSGGRILDVSFLLPLSLGSR